MSIASTAGRVALVVLFSILCFVSFRHHYQIQSSLHPQQTTAVTEGGGSSSLPVVSPSTLIPENGDHDDDDTNTLVFPALAGFGPRTLYVPPSLISLWPMDKGNNLLQAMSSLAAGLSQLPWKKTLSETWFGVMATLLLGFMLGILFSETPFVDPVLRLFGLADSRQFGVDILEGTAWTYASGQDVGGKSGGGGGGGGSGTMTVATPEGWTTAEPTSSSLSNSGVRASSPMTAPVRHSGGRMFKYGLRYTFLNVEVTGGWLGMGLWPMDGTKVPYREACQAMVRKVTSGLGIDATSHLLDVGFGCGDQTVYMAELYRPRRITGITIEPLQHHAAEQLVLNSRDRIPTTKVDLYVADASYLLDFLKEHPQVQGIHGEQSGQDGYFTHIISIDSAYHYNTRRKFFEQSYAALAPGKGRLAMADVIPAWDPPKTGVKGWLLRQFGQLYLQVPIDNMKTLEAYRQDLIEVGFVDIEIEAVEGQVFLGWADFIATQLKVLKSVGLVRPRIGWRFWMLQKVLRYVDRNKTMQFIVVKAKRPE
ncbi:hypothetical protein DFQ27_006944 [Actinomortierella ambigua]|uniref:phosphoethanolamine N-methyltransferase n=1 Tax=Actinomortierella ambigua TaxID=1343610 RepID=A0A9P6PUZ9_9FUNG|nr:hypothetical protein DFQ27_006944 [Actinomortierella ambigua]